MHRERIQDTVDQAQTPEARALADKLEALKKAAGWAGADGWAEELKRALPGPRNRYERRRAEALARRGRS